MNLALSHFCAHRPTGQIGPGEPPEDGDTALLTPDLKFKPWRSEAEQATSRSRRFPTILNNYE